MKAPFSKRARAIFKNKEAIREMNRRKMDGKSIDGLIVKDIHNNTYVLRTSERIKVATVQRAGQA